MKSMLRSFIVISLALLHLNALAGRLEKRLVKAVEEGNAEKTVALIKDGADPNFTREGDTMLMMAMEKGHMTVVDALLANGARLDQSAKNGNIIHKAIPLGNPDMLQVLLNEGVDVNIGDILETTPLMKAASRGKLQMASMLLAAGAKINHQNKMKDTALLLAMKFGQIQMMNLLLDNGADPEIADSRGNTALGLIHFLRRPDMLKVFRERGLAESPDQSAQAGSENRNPKSWTQISDDKLKSKIPRADQEGVEPPVITSRASTAFVQFVLRNPIRGYVILEAVLGADGDMYDIRVLRGLGRWQKGCEYTAIAAIKDWKYTPGKVNGEPTDMRMTVKLDFAVKYR